MSYTIKLVSMISLLLTVVCFGEEVEGKRYSAGVKYNFVGLGSIDGSPVCSFWIIKHGVLVTAKHCFTHLGMNEENTNLKILPKLSVVFKSSNQVILTLNSGDFIKAIFDKGINDLAVITYKAIKTSSVIKLPSMKISESDIEETSKVELIGFPDRRKRPGFNEEVTKIERVKSVGCSITGYSAVSMPTINNPGYDGPLYDTTCAAWFLVGGGPILKKHEDGSLTLYGVVTHTFDVKMDGSIDYEKVQNDQYGPYTAGNFTPFSISESIIEIMR